MKNRNNWFAFNEDDMISASEPAAANQAPIVDPNRPGTIDINVDVKEEKPDPVESDIDDYDDEDDQDFDSWKNDLIEMSATSNVQEMLKSVRVWLNKDLDEPSQAKFVYDNYQILLYREDATIAKACHEIRNNIKKDLDITFPGSSVIQHMTNVLNKYNNLQQVLIKLPATYGMKGDLHRKFIAAILGTIQIGGGNRRSDLIYHEKEKNNDINIPFSTRVASEFGQLQLGRWSLKASDPKEILSASELDRLKDGAPEEKQVLRRRIIIESIAKEFSNRGFLIHVCHEDGRVHAIGWDLGESLSSGYRDGKIIARGSQDDSESAMISANGDIVNLIDTNILLLKNTGEVDNFGMPVQKEIPLLAVRDCTLYISADKNAMEYAGSVLTGLFIAEIPFNGNPSDLKGIRNSVPTIKSILNKDY